MGIAFSKVTTKCQTVIPRRVRELMGIEPGDHIRYVMTEDGVRIERVHAHADEDPFAAFEEWSSEADETDYADL